MLIALANPGGDFTVTLFAPSTTFAHLDGGGDVDAFFAEHFPDFAALTPTWTTSSDATPPGGSERSEPPGGATRIAR